MTVVLLAFQEDDESSVLFSVWMVYEKKVSYHVQSEKFSFLAVQFK